MEELKNTLVKALNENQLPLDCKYYIVKDIFREIHELYYTELRRKESEANVAELDSPIVADMDKQTVNGNGTQPD